MENVLQSFLNIGMIDIGEDDEKFKNLQKASQDVTKKLLKKKSEAINYTLVALDPDIDIDEPILGEVEAFLQKHWNTFKNKFPDTPRQIIRPVIFEGLRGAAESEPAIAVITWLTGSSYFPYANLGREKQICSEFLLQMGGIAEDLAAQYWAVYDNYQPTSLPAFQFELGLDYKVAINDKEFKKELTAAAGPTDPQGQQIQPQINQYGPNSGQAWTNIFIPHASKIITDSVNKSLGLVLNSVAGYNTGLVTELSNYLTSVNNTLSEVLNRSVQGAVANDRRTSLLWWKETLYSPTMRLSYRELESSSAALLMAYDLHKQVPEYCPHSVDYILREAFRGLEESTEKLSDGASIVEFCNQLSHGSEAVKLKQLLGTATQEQGRGTFLTLIQNVLAGQTCGLSDVLTRLGLNGDTKIKMEEFAVWCFHDLQAKRIASIR